MRNAIFWCMAGCLVLVSGCRMGVPPNPNEPHGTTLVSGEILRRNLKWAYEELDRRENAHQITEAEKRERLKEYARAILPSEAVTRIPPRDAWMYGDVYRTAERWEEAKAAYEIAVKAADNEDRRVNDHLRLAFVLGKLGDIDGAIRNTRETFTGERSGKAPILLATLYELVPATEGHGRDLDLARLLEDAIAQHELTIVDPNNVPGRMFLIAKPHHLKVGWKKVVDLYRSADRADLAQQAATKAGLDPETPH